MSINLKTYKQACTDFCLEEAQTGTFGVAEKAGAERFAAYLDKSHLSSALQVLALQQGREVDRVCMTALINHLGEEKAGEILKPILAQFKRK